jgi:hypothetical protein
LFMYFRPETALLHWFGQAIRVVLDHPVDPVLAAKCLRCNRVSFVKVYVDELPGLDGYLSSRLICKEC